MSKTAHALSAKQNKYNTLGKELAKLEKELAMKASKPAAKATKVIAKKAKKTTAKKAKKAIKQEETMTEETPFMISSNEPVEIN